MLSPTEQSEAQSFKLYKELGGRKEWKSYKKLYDNFIKHTLMSYVCCILCDKDKIRETDEVGNYLYRSKNEAWKGFCEATKTGDTECYRLFQSIDDINAYS